MNNPSVGASEPIIGALSSVVLSEGTAKNPKYYEGRDEIEGDVRVHTRFYTYKTEAGLVAGVNATVMCSIDRPARDVWPHFKDFTSWQSSYGHYYSGVVGDLEGKPLRLGSKPNEPGTHQYQVIRVIPEHLIVLDQPVVESGYEGIPWWLGGVSAGFHVFMLDEQRGAKTFVTILMNHASLMERASATQRMTDEEALRPWRDKTMEPEWARKWRNDFIPTLKRLVYEGQ